MAFRFGAPIILPRAQPEHTSNSNAGGSKQLEHRQSHKELPTDGRAQNERSTALLQYTSAEALQRNVGR